LTYPYNTKLCSKNAWKTNTEFLRKKTTKKNVPLIVADPLDTASIYSIGETTRREIRKERDLQ